MDKGTPEPIVMRGKSEAARASEPFVPSHSDTNQFKGDLKNLSRIPQFSETTQTGGEVGQD